MPLGGIEAGRFRVENDLSLTHQFRILFSLLEGTIHILDDTLPTLGMSDFEMDVNQIPRTARFFNPHQVTLSVI